MRLRTWVSLLFMIALLSGCQPVTVPLPLETATQFQLDSSAVGALTTVDHIDNLTVAVRDENVLRAEYKAGFIQGQLQRDKLAGTRANLWDSTALTDASGAHQIPPPAEQIAETKAALMENYSYTVAYADSQADPLRTQFQRLLFRLLGVYQGATQESPADLDFSGAWMPALDTFTDAELTLHYDEPTISFLDLYYMNAYNDVGDALSVSQLTKCSAFVKRLPDDILITHNTWSSFLDQSMAQTYVVNDDFITINSAYPGLIASTTDFGYNDKGILFNETTHHSTYTEPKVDALWMLWRAALAEQFAGSIEEFFDLVSLEASGTYMNGYMVIDAKTREIGLVEMSYQSFVFYRSADGGDWVVTTKPEGLSTDYDHELVQPDVILGVNYPASKLIQTELKAVETRPARRAQFLEFMGDVDGIEAAKALITYTAPDEPLSIYGRWDLGFGDTPTPQTVPDGALDAKATSANMMQYAMQLSGEFDLAAPSTIFWMKYGTPVFDGKPFIWSESDWSDQVLRFVPDVVAGDWQDLTAPVK